MKRVWILNHHSGLEGDRHYELAKEMARAGLEVTVFLSAYDHQKEEYIYQKPVTIRRVQKGVAYVWLHTAPAYHGNGPARILNMADYCRYMKKYRRRFYRKFGRPDVVVGSSVHPFAWESAYGAARENNAPFVCEIRDFWPLSFMEMYGWPWYHPVCVLFSVLERRAYRRADAIVTSMEFGYRYLEKFPYVNRDRVYWIPNGCNTEQIDRVLEEKKVKLPEELEQYLSGHWCAVYTGSFVDSECLFDMLDAAEYLQREGHDEIKFAFIGEGCLRRRMEERIRKQGLKNVRIFPRIEKDQVAVALSKSKACIAALKDDRALNDLGLSLNKLNDYLYSGNPTVFACSSPNVVAESGGGIVVPSSAPEAFAEALLNVYHMPEEERRAMGERGRRSIRERYSYSRLAKQYAEILRMAGWKRREDETATFG